MAKITKKIRIDGYDILKNEFEISFQLRGHGHHLRLVSTHTHPGEYGFAGDGEQELAMLGLDADDIQQIIEEIFDWMEKPRKAFNNLSHGYTMRTRFEATQRLEQERRTKAAVERKQIEAPCLDSAMSVTKEMDDEHAIVDKAEPTKSTLSVTANITDAMMEAAFGERLRWDVTEKPEAAITENGAAELVSAHVLIDGPATDEALAAATDAFQQIIDGRSSKIESFEDVPTEGTIEPAVSSKSVITLKINDKPHMVVSELDASEIARFLHQRIAAREFAGLGEQPTPVKLPTCDNSDDPISIEEARRRITVANMLKAEFEVKQLISPRSTPAASIEDAVTSIHRHVRRFMSPATPREHDFLRAIIQEEIERVVGGVL
ncbi:hypothetical protein [Neorhizobium sp. T6_25]|uniref:hypothetical protein n=1 Tax=Neorhizobium sp. T6_25 TaxID=2093833 RepID=UPI00155E8C85|nr:hypothetical protein [Neorhizobium sp. T6_25]